MMEVIKLANSKGMEMEVCSYGATLMSLKVPDRNNDLVNVVVGLDNAEAYASPEFQEHNLYLGCTVGRYAGRISKGLFELEGKKYSLENENGVHLHGGSTGFDKKNWEVLSTESSRSNNVKFGLQSQHMEGGYPGNIKVTVEYELLESNALRILYKATTDQTTVLNLTNHAYYNLNGEGSVSEHYLQINSNKILELDKKKLPTGKILNCSKTHYDFVNKAKIKKIMESGLDTVYVLSPKPFSAALYSEKSGICMKVLSKQPAVVIYTPPEFPNVNFKDDATYSVFPAICFETQNFPDAPNNKHFPSCVLRSGETYTNETVLDFKILTTN
ncbi:aldose epimerase family protein [Flagellimonas sp. S174]|uniref:aldose epimerase family protein n=1 Tax=Flagellimonas sp. S174 TaxID=3410790 RepID=UPI003BF565E9